MCIENTNTRWYSKTSFWSRRDQWFMELSSTKFYFIKICSLRIDVNTDMVLWVTHEHISYCYQYPVIIMVTVLRVTYKHVWYSAINSMWAWLMRFCELHLNMIGTIVWVTSLTWLIRVYEWYVNMIATGLWVIREHDCYGSMSDMWTWLIRVYEWYVNMIDTGLWMKCEHDWYGSIGDMLIWLIRFYE